MKRKQLVRQKFRDAVFKRDGGRCKFCDSTFELDAHHITDRNEMPNGGYVKENGISLCALHHEDAELFHRSGGKKHKAGFHPDDLYIKIGSSRKLAEEKSSKG